jgi:hypothetical protein
MKYMPDFINLGQNWEIPKITWRGRARGEVSMMYIWNIASFFSELQPSMLELRPLDALFAHNGCIRFINIIRTTKIILWPWCLCIRFNQHKSAPDHMLVVDILSEDIFSSGFAARVHDHSQTSRANYKVNY